MEMFCRKLEYWFSDKIATQDFKLIGGNYNYFKENQSRLKALNDFLDLVQLVYKNKLSKYCINPVLIKVLYPDDVGYDASKISRFPISLDLHDFTQEPATTITNTYLSLIEKHKLPYFRVIVGKSSDKMLEVARNCILAKPSFEAIGNNKDIFTREITPCYETHYDRCNKPGHFDFKFKHGDTKLWPIYDPYIYDETYKKITDEFNEKMRSKGYVGTAR